MRFRSLYRKAALVFSLALVLTMLPVSGAAAAETPAGFCGLIISEMLSAGDYVEGEAIAVVRGTGEFRTAAETEVLSVSDAGSVALAIEKNRDAAPLAAEEAAGRFSDNNDYMILKISDPSKTTEELLTSLYDDPRVLTAEPNYKLDIPAPLSEKDKDKKDTEPAAGEEETDNPGDLTPYQWYIEDGFENGCTTPEAPGEERYSLNVPGWNGKEDNASGTVAVMDTGIDTNHPDLQGVLFEFSEEQQERFACGPYGVNVNLRQSDPSEWAISEEDYRKDIMDHMMHGTHVAGIIAGAWDGTGISGIVKGAKIFGVRVYSDDGMSQSSTDIVRGFEWLASVAREVNLKAVNVSLGTLKSQLIHTIMVNRLGEQGAVVVYAAGNMEMNMDENIDLGAENNSPYAITVDAADPDGKKTQFSCYGQMSTDVFAPGAQILSSVPGLVTYYKDNGSSTGVRGGLFFFPDTTDASHLAFGKTEKFDTKEPAVRFFDGCPVNEDGTVNKDVKETGKLNKEYGFDDNACWEIPAAALGDPEEGTMTQGYRPAHTFWMAVPAEDAESAKWVGGKGAFNDKSHIYTGVVSVVCSAKNKDGSFSPVNIDMRYDNALALGALEDAPEGGLSYTGAANYSSSQWTEWSLDLQGFAGEAAYFHTLDEETRESAGYNLTDPGDIKGIYLWEDAGNSYVLLQIGVMKPETGEIFSSEDTLYLMDDIAIGDDQAATGPYTYMCGTSMAAPCVTACLAVIAKDEPENADLDDKKLKMLALERAAKLLACVDYDDDLADLCRTGGRVNLHGKTEFTKKAPIIARAETDKDEKTLTVTGYFFGREGKLFIDEKEADVSSWSDTKITAELKELSNGSHVVKIVNPDEAVSRIMFGTSGADEGTPVYEKTLALPIGEPGFEEDLTDGFYGSMPSLGDSLYVMTGDSNAIVQGMWRYDTAKDKWFHCKALPKELEGMSVENNSLAAADGKIYLYMYRKGLEEGEPQLWAYDPDADKWEKTEVEGIRRYGQLISFNDRLMFIAELPYEETDEGGEPKSANFNFIDTKEGTLIPVKGEVHANIDSYGDLVMASCGEKICIFGLCDEEEIMGKMFLSRFTYDEKKNEFIPEDISGVLDDILENRQSFTIAGTPEDLVIISPKTPGKDTYLLKNDAEKAEGYERTSCYHTVFAPAAGFKDGLLYVLAMNTTEPDVLYFRATKL